MAGRLAAAKVRGARAGGRPARLPGPPGRAARPPGPQGALGGEGGWGMGEGEGWRANPAAAAEDGRGTDAPRPLLCPGLGQAKDMPKIVSEAMRPNNVLSKTQAFLAEYKAKYIDTGSFVPLQQVMLGVFCLSYTVTWPSEYRHMQHAKEHGH